MVSFETTNTDKALRKARRSIVPGMYNGLRVAGLCADTSGCGSYRIINPLKYLEKLGADVQTRRNFSGSQIFDYQIVIAQRQYDPEVIMLLEEARRKGVTVIYEVDDYLHGVTPDSPVFGIYHLGTKALHGVRDCMSMCNGLTVSTVDLAEYYSRINPNVYVLPNCCAGDTKIVTADHGIKSLEELDGELVSVKTSTGKWLPAEVKSYGIQKLHKLTFEKCGTGLKKYITGRFTRNHRWILEDGSVTDNIQIGNELMQAPMDEELDPEAIRHGLVFGYGHSHKKACPRYSWISSQGREYCDIRLCGEDKKYLDLFDGYRISYPSSANGDPVVYIGKKTGWKELPYTSDPSYIAGFIHGWWLADGQKALLSGCIQIDSVREDAISWLVEHAAYIGCTVISTGISNVRGGFSGPNSKPLRRALLSRNARWKLCKIEEDIDETVYCVEEPVTNSFTLANGLLTGNCIDFDLRDWESPAEEEDEDYLVVGWSGGSTHVGDMEILRPVIPELLKKYDFIKFGLYCSSDMAVNMVEDWELDPNRVKFITPRPFDEYPKGLGAIDIALIPVHNTSFNTSKSCLKAIEFGAKKVPSICSCVAPYVTTIQEGVDGYLARTTPEWIEKASILIENESERRRIGEAIYQKVRSQYDLANNIHMWPKAWGEIINSSKNDIKKEPIHITYGRVGRNDPCPCGRYPGYKYKNCPAGCYPAWGK